MSRDIYNIYSDTVKYAQHLEYLLTKDFGIADEDIKRIRELFIKPATNVAKEWLEGETK